MPPASLPWCRFTKRAFAVRHGTDGALQLTGYGAGASRGTAHGAQPHRTFREYNLHLDRDQPEAHRIWILKPLGGFNQIGIHMYSLGKSDVASDEATAAWLFRHTHARHMMHMHSACTCTPHSLCRRIPEGSWVLQEYAMNIMTYDGNKFDLRVWAAVTSLDPLRIYLLGTGIPKVPHAHALHMHMHSSYECCCRCCPRQISQWKYSKAPELVKEQCIHVLLPGTAECYTSSSPLVNVLNPYPRSTSDSAWPTHTKPSGKRQWQRAWESIEAQLVELMLLTREARSPRW